MQDNDLAIISGEKGDEILREIRLVRCAQAANDGAVQRNPFGVTWIANVHKDVARMHVSVKKIVVKDLGEKRLNTLVR